MTGTGAYFYLVWGIWLRRCLGGEQDEYDLYWPSIWSFPSVERTNATKQNGSARPAINSSAKEGGARKSKSN